jgi:hypothetical protein
MEKEIIMLKNSEGELRAVYLKNSERMQKY